MNSDIERPSVEHTAFLTAKYLGRNSTPPPPHRFQRMARALPVEIQALKAFCLYRTRPAPKPGGKPAKIPYRVDDGPASSTDPDTWSTLGEVIAKLRSDTRYVGVNFATGQHEDGYYYATIDIDHAKDIDCNHTSDAREIINLAGSYSETSPSGNGVRIIIRSSQPYDFRRHRVKNYNVEIEDGNKFNSITGNHIAGTPRTLSDGRAAIAHIQRQFNTLAKPSDEIVESPGVSRFADDELIQRASRAKNGARFIELMSGKPMAGESEADYELLCILAFWSCRDPEQMERIFSASERGSRNKWKCRPDYRRRTIEAAIRRTSPVYGGDPASSSDAVTPILVCLADVAVKPTEWLWTDRIPLDELALLAGCPGLGKSYLTCELAMHVSTGTKWPDGTQCPIGDVLIISAEDNPAKTIRPRLNALGADVNRIQLMSMVQKTDGGERIFSLLDVPALEAALQQLPTCKLVIVDPIGSFVGGKTNTDKDNQVRSVLAPIAKLAERYGVTVLLVAHRRKAFSERADDGIIGSVAFVGIARAALHLVRDPHDKERRLLLPGKMNLAPEITGLAFKIIGRPGIVQWETEPVTVRADDFFSAQQDSKPGPDPTTRNEAEKWLVDLLATGNEVAIKDIQAGAKAMGYVWKTVQRAAKGLPIVPRWDGPGTPGYWRIQTTDVPNTA